MQRSQILIEKKASPGFQQYRQNHRAAKMSRQYPLVEAAIEMQRTSGHFKHDKVRGYSRLSEPVHRFVQKSVGLGGASDFGQPSCRPARA
jgi:hypothetical protein